MSAAAVVPKGYKRTEVGVIPEEWEVIQLRECLAEPPRYGINAPAVPQSDLLPAYIRITDISEEGKYAPDSPVCVNRADAASYYLEDGDLVFARTGASVGKSYLHRNANGRLVFAGFLIKVRTDRQRLIPEHLAALATTGSYWRWVRLMSMRSGQPGINGREYGQLPLGVPPLPEQRAIAAALGDVDALLAALDAQIAKQRDLKQATMQQLLTGQTRLPGFTGEWQRRKLRDIACLNRINVIPANSPTDTFVHFSLPAFDGGKEPVVELGALIESNKFGVPQNAVLLSKLNPRIPRVWAPTEIPSNAVASTEFLILTPNGETSRAFLYVLCGSPAFCEEMELSATGTTGSHQRISPGTALDIEVMTPPSREEQDAIAAVLSDMDEVVSILQSRRAKTAALKQSMMQALLTGRIRLVEDVSRGAAENAEVNA